MWRIKSARDSLRMLFGVGCRGRIPSRIERFSRAMMRDTTVPGDTTFERSGRAARDDPKRRCFRAVTGGHW